MRRGEGVDEVVWMARVGARLRTRAVKYTDSRVHLTEEILNGIQVIKYNGWIPAFLRRIKELRRNEIYRIKRSSFVKASPSTIQDPILFQGSVRFNLDPFGVHTDVEIYEALKRVHLLGKIQCRDRGLDSLMSQNGENFSVGQRQLICLARSLLRRYISQNLLPAKIVMNKSET
ncbi:hypothetical protein L7F22_021832 [Adiantum nelumboides]|nr:hypothetical protein [Adiantum nelumboides]